MNPFVVVLRIASFGTKLLEADNFFFEGGTTHILSFLTLFPSLLTDVSSRFILVGKLQLLKECDEAVAHFESVKQAFKVAMRMPKKETAAHQVVEAERDTPVEQIYMRTFQISRGS